MQLAFPVSPLPWPQSFAAPTAHADSQPHQLHRLFRLLRRMAGREETLTFGGIQHLLNRHQHEQSQQEQQQQPALPDSLLLAIFAHLSAAELGLVARVCSQWHRVAGDELLWRFLLRRDQSSWASLSHEANPDLFEATGADLGSKERYLRCSPRFRASQRRLSPEPNLSPLTRLLPALLRRAWPAQPPKLAVLGPGLDAGCSSLARKILADPDGGFEIGKAFPGVHGIGSGFYVSLSNPGLPVHFGLTFLYSAPRAERENAHNHNHSRLFQTTEAGPALSHGFKELCAGLHGLLFVLDATCPLSAAREAEVRAELRALAEHCWSARISSPQPLLVLSLLPAGEPESKRCLSCMDVIRQLDLNAIRLPWRVYSADIDSAAGLTDGLRWLTDVISDSQ